MSVAFIPFILAKVFFESAGMKGMDGIKPEKRGDHELHPGPA